jgi:hypothetical protein
MDKLEKLDILADLLLDHLITKAKSGELTAQEASVIRNLLRDNSMQMDPNSKDAQDLIEVAGQLPEFDEDGEQVLRASFG